MPRHQTGSPPPPPPPSSPSPRKSPSRRHLFVSTAGNNSFFLGDTNVFCCVGSGARCHCGCVLIYLAMSRRRVLARGSSSWAAQVATARREQRSREVAQERGEHLFGVAPKWSQVCGFDVFRSSEQVPNYPRNHGPRPLGGGRGEG